jgi:glutathione S-transferase
MKLYLAPFTCAQACHITLREAGLAFTPVRVDTKTKKLEDGGDFYAINPKGYVPVLELDTGERLTEAPVVLQYIADLAPTKNLAPANGTLPRYRVQEWLNYISAELHKPFSPLFNGSVDEAVKAYSHAALDKRFALIEQHLATHEYLVGENYSIADIFLFVVAGWSRFTGRDLSKTPKLDAYCKRILQRQAVQDALAAEKPAK